MITTDLPTTTDDTTTTADQLTATLRRRRARRLANGQRGMTLLEILIVLAIIALVMGLLVGPKILKAFGNAKTDLARTMVQKYANEAYVEWATHNPSKTCPGAITELNEFMNQKEAKDPWGNPLEMLCGDALPPGAHGIGILSYGENGKKGDGDDIKSWE